MYGNGGYDNRGLFITSTALVGAGFLFLAYLNYQSDNLLQVMCYAALLAGLFFETGSVTSKWKTVWILVLVSSVISIIVFAPDEGTGELTNAHYWPVVFCGLFTIMVTVVFEKTFIPKLTEGMVMLQSIGIIYWILDLSIWEFDSRFLTVVIGAPAVISALSILHAFSNLELNKTARLAQSIWSALLMLAFAADNFWGLLFGASFDDVSGVYDAAYFGGKYFLTGASLIYVVESFFLFIPRDDEESPSGTTDLVKLHVDRFSPDQTERQHAMLAMVFSVMILGLNYWLDLVPRQIAIWSVFVTFPIFLNLFVYVINQRR